MTGPQARLPLSVPFVLSMLSGLVGCGDSDPRPVVVQTKPEAPEDRGPPPIPTRIPPKVGTVTLEIAAKGETPVSVPAGKPIPIKGKIAIEDVGDGVPRTVRVAIRQGKVTYDSANGVLSERDASGSVSFETELKGLKPGDYVVRIGLDAETIAERPLSVSQ